MRAERQIIFWLTAAALLILTIALLKAILLPFIVGITRSVTSTWIGPLKPRASSSARAPFVADRTL